MHKTKNKQFSRILVPIDGSEPSLNAAYRAATMLTKEEYNNAELIVLHVIHSASQGSMEELMVFGIRIKHDLNDVLCPCFDNPQLAGAYSMRYHVFHLLPMSCLIY